MRIELLAERLTPGLKPLAPVAYNYAWSWDPDGPAVFRDINPHRWQLSGENPVRFLNDLWPSTQEAAERNPELLARVEALAGRIDAMLSRAAGHGRGIDGPVVFMCAEFGFHASMPIYSGGLGVLAGDILKEASDQALEMVGIGLLYRRGYFRQRLDLSGRQQEYWLELDPKSLPMARVTAPDGSPLLLEVELYGAPLQFQVVARRRRPRAARSSSTPSCPRTTPSSAGRPHACTTETAPCGSPSTGCSGSAARGCSRRSGSSPR